MRNRKSVVAAVALVSGLAAACGGNNIGPGRTVTSVSIAGVTAFNSIGATSQLTAKALFTDGTSRDVTSECQWSSSDSSVVSVTPSGLVTAGSYGAASITAAYGSQPATMKVRVLPAGTFLLTGTVSDARSQGRLAGATVRVTSSAGTWSMQSRPDGEYTLPAVGDVTVTAEKAGYDTVQQSLTVNDDAQLNLKLTLTMPAVAYHLTVTASSSCSLPPQAARATYYAEIDEAAGNLVVHLSGAQFGGYGGEAGFTGVRTGNSVQFRISDDPFDAYSFIEVLTAPTRWITHVGTANGTITGDSITATFSGWIRVIEYPGAIVEAACQAGDHKFEFVR